MQAGLPVEVFILQGVNDIEAGYPQHYGGAEDQGNQVQPARDGEIASYRRGGFGETEAEMRGSREALEVRIARQERHGDERKVETKPVQHEGGGDKNNAGDKRESDGLYSLHLAFRDGTVLRARVGGVYFRVDRPVEGHAGRPRGGQRYGDQQPGLKAMTAGEKQAEPGERQSEQGLLRDQQAGELLKIHTPSS